jgi:hypothetical protein
LVDYNAALNPAPGSVSVAVSVVGSCGSECQPTDNGWRDEADAAATLSAIVMMTVMAVVTTAPSTMLRVSRAGHRCG